MIKLFVKGAAITRSRPKVHRFPASAKASRFARVKKWVASRSDRDKAYVLSGVSAVFVVSAIIIHISKLWGGAFIPEASAHVIVQPAVTINQEKSDKSIIINGKDGGIIGQMATMPTQADTAPDIKSMTDVDNRASRDLLSVVNKY